MGASGPTLVSPRLGAPGRHRGLDGRRLVRAPVLSLLAGALALLTVAFFFREPLVGGGQFYHGDAHALIYPLKEFVAREFAAGRLPLWDPHSLCGYPVLSSYIAQVLLPQNLLYLLFPFGYGFALFVVTKHLLAAVFQFLFLRRVGLPRRAAAPAAVLFALSGPLLSLSSYHAFAFECFPLLTWLWWRTLDTDDGWRRFDPWLVSILGFSFAFLHGDLQTIYAGGLLALLLPLAVGRCGWKKFGSRAVMWLGLTAAAVLVTAVQFLPSAAILAESERGALPREERLAHSLDVARLGEVAWPLAAEEAGASDDFVAFKYIGASALVLAATGLFLSLRRRGPWRRTALFFTAAATVALLLALGGNVPLLEPLSEVLPGLKLFRYPQKWLGLAAFAISTLAAIGIASLAHHGFHRLALVLGPAAMLDVFLVASPFLEERLVDNWVYSPEILPHPGDHVRDFGVHERILRLPTNGIAQGVRFPDPEARSGGPSRKEYRARVIAWNIQTLLGNNASRAGLRRVSGLTSFRFRDAELLWRTAAQRRQVAFLADLMAARWVLTTPGDAARLRRGPGIEGLVPSGPPAASWQTDLGRLEIYERPSALPRATIATELVVARNRDAALEALFAPDFDPRRQVVALSPPPAAASREAASTRPGEPRVRFLAEDPTRLRLHAEDVGARGGYLVLNDSYAPGWTARVDGRPVPVVRANMFARAVPIPPGSCQVEFSYRPKGLLLGAVLSLLALAALLGAKILSVSFRRGYTHSS